VESIIKTRVDQLHQMNPAVGGKFRNRQRWRGHRHYTNEGPTPIESAIGLAKDAEHVQVAR
jgi:hypothetical protein